jgi:rubrerythrin
MTEKNATGLLNAIKSAMDAEQKAAAFYKEAAQHTSDPKGKDMFTQLVAFEQGHYATLGKLLASVENGQPGTVQYDSASFRPTTPAVSGLEKQAGAHLQSAIDAVTLAIAAEKKARDNYRAMAVSADDQALVDLFMKLADEEELHRKVLDDQFFALANKGTWTGVE